MAGGGADNGLPTQGGQISQSGQQGSFGGGGGYGPQMGNYTQMSGYGPQMLGGYGPYGPQMYGPYVPQMGGYGSPMMGGYGPQMGGYSFYGSPMMSGYGSPMMGGYGQNRFQQMPQPQAEVQPPAWQQNDDWKGLMSQRDALEKQMRDYAAGMTATTHDMPMARPRYQNYPPQFSGLAGLFGSMGMFKNGGKVKK